MILSASTLLEPEKTYVVEYVLSGDIYRQKASELEIAICSELASQGVQVNSVVASGNRVKVEIYGGPKGARLFLLEPLIITTIPAIINYITSLLIAAYFITQTTIPLWGWAAIVGISGTAALYMVFHKRKKKNKK